MFVGLDIHLFQNVAEWLAEIIDTFQECKIPPPGLEPGSLGWEPSILTS